MRLASHVSNKSTPQTEPIPGREQEMTKNSAGGVVFKVDKWAQLQRFLVLGSSAGTYYVSERALTQENAKVVVECAKENAAETVRRIVAVSDGGKAPKNDYAVFALALTAANADQAGKKIAYEAVPKVCRIGTHIFQFASASSELRGWGRGLREAVGNWYKALPAQKMAYQLVKYQQRDGWSHRDLFRLSHPKFEADSSHNIAANWAVKGWETVGDEPHPNKDVQMIWAFEKAKRATTVKEIVTLIEDYDLPRECVPTQFLTEKSVWMALLDAGSRGMPITAMIRNLATMSKIGLLTPLHSATINVIEKLNNREALKHGRVHPLNILAALRTYAGGKSIKGDATWTPTQSIVDALDNAFYLAFDAVEPTNKRWLFGLDVSGSMSSPIANSVLSCCEAATALSLVTTAVEPYTFTGAFNTGFQPIPIGKKTRLDEALRYTRGVNFGGTDCSLPMLYALENKIDADVFVSITDNETYAGRIQPTQALKRYRDKMGINAKMIVVGMTASNFTVSDPKDADQLDVVGFSTDTPVVMSEFAKS